MSDAAAVSSSLDAMGQRAAERAGRPPRLRVEGVGGSGKTALLRQLARRWQSEGLSVVWAQGRRLELDRPGGALASVVTSAADPWVAGDELTTAVGDRGVVVVDDAQWLDHPSLRALAAAASRGVPVVVSHRPTLRHDVGALLVSLADSGSTLVLGPLDLDGIAGLAKETAESPPLSAEDVALLHRRSAGRPGWARRLIAARRGDDSAVLDPIPSHVAYELALLGEPGRRLVTALAVGASADDAEVLVSQVGDRRALTEALLEVQAAGLLVPEGDELVPAVAEAVRALTPSAERRRVAAEVAPGRLLLHRAEAALVAGEPAEAVTLAERSAEQGADAWRARRVVALGLAVQGLRSTAAARLASLEHGPRPLEALDAVPLLMAAGDLAEARRLAASATAVEGAFPSVAEEISLLVAKGMLATVDSPGTALATLIDASRLAEAAGTTSGQAPFSPHALAASVASAIGRLPLAQRLTDRARRHEVGGQLQRRHHLLLAGWVAMRAGRWAAAEEALAEADAGHQSGDLLATALEAGLARRSGDVPRLGAAWEHALDLLVGWRPDLLSLEVVGELAAAAARLGQWAEMAPVARELGSLVDALGRPPLWEIPRRWFGLQAAIAADDAASASRRAAEMGSLASSSLASSSEPTSPYAWSLSTIAGVWASTLSGGVDPGAVDAAARALQDLSLPWEASRLLGAAAIRAEDATVTRRLLEEARDLRAGLSAPSEGDLGVLGGSGVLSERERQVAAGVAEGLTYKELGERLFISPKTVEHHVAKIRQKLGISSRSEMLSALRATRGSRG